LPRRRWANWSAITIRYSHCGAPMLVPLPSCAMLKSQITRTLRRLPVPALAYARRARRPSRAGDLAGPFRCSHPRHDPQALHRTSSLGHSPRPHSPRQIIRFRSTCKTVLHVATCGLLAGRLLRALASHVYVYIHASRCHNLVPSDVRPIAPRDPRSQCGPRRPLYLARHRGQSRTEIQQFAGVSIHSCTP
jgi:hypothetical protein